VSTSRLTVDRLSVYGAARAHYVVQTDRFPDFNFGIVRYFFFAGARSPLSPCPGLETVFA